MLRVASSFNVSSSNLNSFPGGQNETSAPPIHRPADDEASADVAERRRLRRARLHALGGQRPVGQHLRLLHLGSWIPSRTIRPHQR